MKIHSLFPTPVYEHQGTQSEIFLIQDEIRKKLPIILETDTFSNPKGWNDGVMTNIAVRHNSIKDFELTHLKKYIELHVKNYLKLIQSAHPVPIALRHSWFNMTSKGQKQDWHQHQDSFISGCYYFQTTGNDGKFSIMNPCPWMQQEVFPMGGVSEKYAEITPAVGKILLFPGWLQHCVEENTTDDTRISISWNFYRDYFQDYSSQDTTYI